MAVPAPIVYLDSSDFSTLSDPKSPPGIASVRESLRALAASGAARFAFSSVHVCEMAPLTPLFTSSAMLRSGLLSELCQRNAMVSFDSLWDQELGSLVSGGASAVRALSDSGEWFPDIGEVLGSIPLTTLPSELEKASKDRGLSRKHRRRLDRQLFKHGRPRPLLVDLLRQQDTRQTQEDLLRLFPMRPEDANALARYAYGQGGKAEAERALRASLSDPKWMMQWFASREELLSPITEWVRRPAQQFSSKVREAAMRLAVLSALFRELGVTPFSDLSASALRVSGRKLFLEIASKALQERYGEGHTITDDGQLERHCPGLTLAMKVAYSAVIDATNASQPRDPTDSDFVDAVHASYVPYVDVFRADRYMSALIKRHARHHRTVIVSRLIDLPGAIASCRPKPP